MNNERTTSPPTLRTIGTLEVELGEPRHRIEHIIRTRRIPEAARVGRVRVFDGDALAIIREELHAIDRRRQGVSRD